MGHLSQVLMSRPSKRTGLTDDSALCDLLGIANEALNLWPKAANLSFSGTCKDKAARLRSASRHVSTTLDTSLRYNNGSGLSHDNNVEEPSSIVRPTRKSKKRRAFWNLKQVSSSVCHLSKCAVSTFFLNSVPSIWSQKKAGGYSSL